MKSQSNQEIDLEEFYIRYGPMVLRRCRTLLSNEQSAYDAMQEVFLNILKNRKRLHGSYPSALLYRIATNVCLNRIRNEYRHKIKNYSSLVYNFDHSNSEEASSSARILWEFILEMEHGFKRTIAVMYFINGMTIQEIASVTKLSVSGVHKKLKQLKRRIQHTGEV